MEERNIAVKKAKIGYVSIAVMLIVNILLATFIFFNLTDLKVRELFLAIGVLMALIYAISFPTKLLPSGSYLLRCIVFVMLPLILTLLIATEKDGGAVAIVAYVIALVIAVFCAYINFGYQTKIIKYIKEENYNDYVLFEYKTFKTQEVNIYTFAFIFINFFIMMSAGIDVVLTVVIYLNLIVGLTFNFYRVRALKSDKIKMTHYALESLSTLIAFSLIVVVNALELSSLIYIVAVLFLIPTLLMTIAVYKSLDKFMYK